MVRVKMEWNEKNKMGNKQQQDKGQGLKLLVLHCGPINKSIAGGYHLWGFFLDLIQGPLHVILRRCPFYLTYCISHKQRLHLPKLQVSCIE